MRIKAKNFSIINTAAKDFAIRGIAGLDLLVFKVGKLLFGGLCLHSGWRVRNWNLFLGQIFISVHFSSSIIGI